VFAFDATARLVSDANGDAVACCCHRPDRPLHTNAMARVWGFLGLLIAASRATMRPPACSSSLSLSNEARVSVLGLWVSRV